MERVLSSNLPDYVGKKVHLRGTVLNVRKMGGITFLVLSDRKGTAQIVGDSSGTDITKIRKYDIVTIDGSVRAEPRARGGVEVVPQGISVLSSPPIEGYPIAVTPKALINLDTLLEHRPISIRNPRTRNIFIVQQAIAQAFREYLQEQDFIEIFTPKIVPQGAEGGSAMFSLQYFDRPAFLTQSPQFYKQMLAGSGFERVFEIGHVYRAEEHNTARHLNEYVSMDIEMAFIDSVEDLMVVEEGLLKHIFGSLKEKHENILKEFGKDVPKFDRIPRVPLLEMKEILQNRYGKRFEEGKDIDPEGERLALKYAKEDYNSDLIFLTKYPAKNRPFYTRRDPENPALTASFDLILDGLEITTGGQRIHEYDALVANMREFGIAQKGCEGYLMAFKYGMPPHGGMGIGLERLTMKVLGLENIREACLFPRDRTRCEP